MKKFIFLAATLFAAIASLNSCQDSPQAGSSLVQDQLSIVIDSAFTVAAQSDSLASVDSRTITQLLGAYRAEGYGTLRSDIVCQYMPAASMDTVGVRPEYIDSIHLILTMAKGAFTGDSTAPMGIKVFRLDKQLPYPLGSSFDPAGYFDPSRPIGTAVYSAKISGEPNVHATSGTSPVIYKDVDVKLPRELGQEFYKEYIQNPSTYASPQAFAKFFPGLYITTEFGSGRITRFAANTLNIFYRSVERIGEGTDNPRDTTFNRVGIYMGVTPEVNTNNNLTYSIAPDLQKRITDGETLLVGPVGYDVQFNFPAADIAKRFAANSGLLGVVNSLSFSIPAENLRDDYGFTPPPYILMVKKDKRSSFFTDMKLTDNVNSFYAAYDATNRCYTFSNMRDYINTIVAKQAKGDAITAADTEFVITPVAIAFFSSTDYYGNTVQTLNTITPYVYAPIAVKLDFKKAKINFSYSKQSL